MSPAVRPLWDIFCNVIDNFGDIGVCWRLARQLATEHGLAVRLWVDDLASFQRICPSVDVTAERQYQTAVEVLRWSPDFTDTAPGDVVVEAFACQLPERFVAAMAARERQPVWVNLDYLSAEAWVAGCHALPSPHPRLPLTKYFFFPGFSAQTGGLLREACLDEERRAYLATPSLQAAFWRQIGQQPPSAAALKVSLFAYPQANLQDLLTVWAAAAQPVCCLIPVGQPSPRLDQLFGQAAQPGTVTRRGNLEIRCLPFVAQPEFDRLLWSCDVNFVRGEDSFVRAQWAALPMIWQIYPQDEAAHLIKLNAFLDRYCAGLPATSAAVARRVFLAWNGAGIDGALWQAWAELLPTLRRHALNWANELKKQQDLCTSLVHFCHSKL